MGKDLRTMPTYLKLHRYPRLDGTLWGLRNPQPFFPPLEKLFKTDTLQNLQDYGVQLTDEIQSIVDETNIRTIKGRTVPVHRKTTMILSPFKWMRGDYGNLGLPKPESVAKDIQTKLQSPHTAGYVGAMTSIVLSESACVHFPKVYGVYVGLAAKHTIDISDDYEDLSERRWFADNLGKTFELRLRTPTSSESEFHHTRNQRPEVLLGEEALLDEIEDVEADHVSEPESRSQSESHASSADESFLQDSESEDDDDVFDIQSCDCMDVDEDEEGEEAEEEEPFAWATFSDVPVITTVMEQCKGTFYDLLKEHPEPAKHAAWVAQLVMALAYAQRTFGFTHNDLHGNNVMYVPTQEQFLYYKHNGVAYRIPTYGCIIKVIDFDRAITMVRLNGMKEARTFASSQFQVDEEAAGQYNMEPFFDHHHPLILPNASFDLCRFATSLFWDMFPEGPDDASINHPLFEVFKQWMLQSDGSSIMFRQQRDNHDRYHGFHLYKAIARYCKDSAVPRREIQKLNAFQIPQPPLGTPCLFIES